MVQRLPSPEVYRFDIADPRAPSSAQWARMTPAEQARVVAMLPSEYPAELATEGDPHRKATTKATDTLDDFFRTTGRKIYVSSELAVYYPNEPRFAPDILAVLDVDRHERTQWVTDAEGKGLDLVIEVHYAGNKTKDDAENVERYARLGIAEYFIFNRAELSLKGFRLAKPEGRRRKKLRNAPILAQGGRFASSVLGLDLLLDGTRLRFMHGNAALLGADELCAKLGTMVDDLMKKYSAEAARSARLDAELSRERAEVKARDAKIAELRSKLAEANAEVERLKQIR